MCKIFFLDFYKCKKGCYEILSNKSCDYKCPPNTYKDGYVCKTCTEIDNPSKKVCTETGLTDCLYEEGKNTCVTECSIGMFIRNGVCKACEMLTPFINGSCVESDSSEFSCRSYNDNCYLAEYCPFNTKALTDTEENKFICTPLDCMEDGIPGRTPNNGGCTLPTDTNPDKTIQCQLFDGKCYSRCPKNTYEDGFVCKVKVCGDRDPIGVNEDCNVIGDSSSCRSFKGNCHSTCPFNSEPSKDSDFICIPVCNQRIPVGDNCLLGGDVSGSCRSFEGNCYLTCPLFTEAKTGHEEEELTCSVIVCDSRIPNGDSCLLDGEIVGSCFSYDGHCYSKCPTNSKLSETNELICIPSCNFRTPADDSCLRDSELVGSCRSFEDSCYSTCPKNTIDSEDNGLICITSCNHRTPVDDNCLVGTESRGSCRSFKGNCYSTCPLNTIAENDPLVCIVDPSLSQGGNNDNKSLSFPWWIILILLAVVVLITLIIMLILKKRKKNGEKEMDIVSPEDELEKSAEGKEFSDHRSSILYIPDDEKLLKLADHSEESLLSNSEKEEGSEDNMDLCPDLLFTPVTYSKQKDEFFVCEKKPCSSPFFIKARLCDSPHEVILVDKRRTLFSFFSEIQVLFSITFYKYMLG
jgi:hypothetical protein